MRGQDKVTVGIYMYMYTPDADCGCYCTTGLCSRFLVVKRGEEGGDVCREEKVMGADDDGLVLVFVHAGRRPRIRQSWRSHSDNVVNISHTQE